MPQLVHESLPHRWPAGLERFLACALQRDPDDRFPSAEEALAAWSAILPMAVTRRAEPPPQRPSIANPQTATDVDGSPTMTEIGGNHWDGAATATEVGDGYDEGTR